MLRSEVAYEAVSNYEKEFPTRTVYAVYITERAEFFEINIKSRDKHKKMYDDDVTVWRRNVSDVSHQEQIASLIKENSDLKDALNKLKMSYDSLYEEYLENEYKMR